MSLILYASSESLYSSKARIALRAKQLVEGTDWRQAAPPGGSGSAAFRAIAPEGTLPALDDGGFVLTESAAILEYIEETRPFPPLMPGDAQGRARARMFAAFHDTRLEPALRLTFPLVGRAGAEAFAEPAALIGRRLAEVDALAEPAPLLCGAALSLADCGYAPCFAWIDAIAEACGFAVAWPERLRLYQRMLSAHPAVAAEFETYPAAMAGWIARRMG